MSRAEDLVGNVLHITPQSGDTINPLISGPIVTIIPEKIKLSYTLLDQARVSLSAIQPQYADPFSETERAAYCITMEQTRRIAVWFNADSDETAEEKALEIYHNTPAKDFEAGDDERDCTLYNKDTGKMVFDWD